jgi:hypothetical protein
MRTYKSCFTPLNENIIQKLSPDIFIHTWSNQGRVSNKEEPYTDVPKNNTIKQSIIKELYGAERVVVEDFQQSYYKQIKNVSVPDNIESHKDYVKSILPLFYKMYGCNKLKRSKENREEFKYDIVIVTRPDMAILSPLPQKIMDNAQFLYHLQSNGSDYVEDRLAVSSSENIDYYTSIFDQLNNYWENTTENELSKEQPYCTRAQSLLGRHMNETEIDLKSLEDYNYRWISDWITTRYGFDVSFYQKGDFRRILHILKNGDTGIPHVKSDIRRGLLTLRRDGIYKFISKGLSYLANGNLTY